MVRIKAEIAKLHLPADVRFENWYDQGDFIISSILSTRDSIFIGVLLAMIVVFLFLRSWRVSLVMLLVVPATIASTFACFYSVGLTINIMTLGGIAAAVGLIIDDSIVVIENIFTHFSKHQPERGDGAGGRICQHRLRIIEGIDACNYGFHGKHHRHSHSAGISWRRHRSVLCIAFYYHGVCDAHLVPLFHHARSFTGNDVCKRTRHRA